VKLAGPLDGEGAAELRNPDPYEVGLTTLTTLCTVTLGPDGGVRVAVAVA
jgi:hypothetical protein